MVIINVANTYEKKKNNNREKIGINSLPDEKNRGKILVGKKKPRKNFAGEKFSHLQKI